MSDVLSSLLSISVTLAVLAVTSRWWNPIVGWYPYLDHPRRRINRRRYAVVMTAVIVANVVIAVVLW